MSLCNFVTLLPFTLTIPIPSIALPIPDLVFSFELPSFFCPLD